MRAASRDINTVSVIDDQPDARYGPIELLKDLGINATALEGPLGSFNDVVGYIKGNFDAVICDHKLGIKNFATFEGATLVSRLYQEKVPAILCTQWNGAASSRIKSLKKYIPVIINPEDLDETSFMKALELCIHEHEGRYLTSRVAHRALVRIEDHSDDSEIYVCVPAWNPHQVVSLNKSIFPQNIVKAIGDGVERFHTMVNIGCDEQSELFFDYETWEIR